MPEKRTVPVGIAAHVDGKLEEGWLGEETLAEVQAGVREAQVDAADLCPGQALITGFVDWVVVACWIVRGESQ